MIFTAFNNIDLMVYYPSHTREKQSREKAISGEWTNKLHKTARRIIFSYYTQFSATALNFEYLLNTVEK